MYSEGHFRPKCERSSDHRQPHSHAPSARRKTLADMEVGACRVLMGAVVHHPKYIEMLTEAFRERRDENLHKLVNRSLMRLHGESILNRRSTLASRGERPGTVSPTIPDDVSAAFAALPVSAKARLTEVRDIVFEVSQTLPETGGVLEYLAWGQPSYRPQRPRVGTAVRLGLHEAKRPAVFVHCSTSLISDFKSVAGHLQFSGNRAVLLPLSGPLPAAELRDFVSLAFTYSSRPAS